MILAGTGHRPTKLGGYSQQAQAKLQAFAVHKLQELKPDSIISGMALGWDQALALGAMTLGIPFVAAVPFQGQETAWPQDSQIQFRKILAKADKIVYCSPPGYAAWKMQIRNEWMVDNCDQLLALFDGTEGGTCNCVRYAARQGKSILNVWDEWIGKPMKEIKGFKGEYEFLSNMYPCTIKYMGMAFTCSEAVYMGCKSGKMEDLARFVGLDGRTAKKLGRTVVLRSDWNQKKVGFMKYILRMKFEQNPDLLAKLVATEQAYLEETNYWKDTFWGVCDGTGQNNLGKILMELRDEFTAK